MGEAYHLRDVDCHDGHLAADAVYASVAPLSEEGVCPAPPTDLPTPYGR